MPKINFMETQNPAHDSRSDKDFLATILLCFFLGSLGVHRFYVGKVGTLLMRFYYLKHKIYIMILLSIAILFIGYSCLQIETTFGLVLGILNLTLGGVTFCIAVRFIVLKTPVLTIDTEGIYDSRVMTTVIPWGNIKDFELLKIKRTHFLKLDVSKSYSDFKWLYRKLSQKNLNKNPQVVLINLKNLNVDFEHLKNALETQKSELISG